MKRFHGFTDADIKRTKARRSYQQGDDRDKEWGNLDDEFRFSDTTSSSDEGESLTKKPKIQTEVYYAKKSKPVAKSTEEEFFGYKVRSPSSSEVPELPEQNQSQDNSRRPCKPFLVYIGKEVEDARANPTLEDLKEAFPHLFKNEGMKKEPAELKEKSVQTENAPIKDESAQTDNVAIKEESHHVKEELTMVNEIRPKFLLKEQLMDKGKKSSKSKAFYVTMLISRENCKPSKNKIEYRCTLTRKLFLSSASVNWICNPNFAIAIYFEWKFAEIARKLTI